MSLSHDIAGVLKDGMMPSAEVRSMWLIHRPSAVVTAGQFPSVVRLKNKLLMGFDPFLFFILFFLQYLLLCFGSESGDHRFSHIYISSSNAV